MIVLKFGGTSIADADQIRAVGDILEKCLTRKPVVILSALSGVTDTLIRLAQEALEKGSKSIDPIRRRHQKVIQALGIEEDIVGDLLQDYRELLKGISLVKELTPRSLDYAMSFGERFSVRIIAAHLCQRGIPAEPIVSYDIGLHTDAQFGKALPLPDLDGPIAKAIRGLKKVPVITGFIGKAGPGGDVTTLGRGGSDYSAAIIGSAIGAEEIQIWTDVDGIMTADPEIVPDARPIDILSFDEASELAYFGARVIHPSTMIPAIKKSIAIRVLNTYRPEAPGTLVVRERPPGAQVVRSIAHKRNITLINIVSTRMLQQHGFMARVFEVFARREIVIDLISTSEVSVSISTDSKGGLDDLVEEISEFGRVTLEREKTIICVVGQGMRDAVGVAARIFESLGEAGVPVRLITQGATRINISLVVENRDVEPAVRALHRAFFD
ncbi:MAG: aspartate kinase [Planctomycetota bacterium]|nr:aspartate kinase [Planctomycetota bacterium]